MQTKQGHAMLDKVCIIQKYYDSNEVLKCRKEFEEAERYIINCVNCHEDNIQLLVECLQWFRVLDKEIESGRAWSKVDIKAKIKQALAKAGE